MELLFEIQIKDNILWYILLAIFNLFTNILLQLTNILLIWIKQLYLCKKKINEWIENNR